MHLIKLNKEIYSVKTIKEVIVYLKSYISIKIIKDNEKYVLIESAPDYEKEIIDYLNYFEFKNGSKKASEK